MVWVDKFTSGQHSGLYGACDVLHGGVVAGGCWAVCSGLIFYITTFDKKIQVKIKKSQII